MQPIQTAMTWQDIEISIYYKPRWIKSSSISHLEIHSLEPDRAPLPVTETGYKSHFFHSDEIFFEMALKQMVEQWLDEAAQSPKWQAYTSSQQNQQLLLF